jgi:hypothetical protein
MQAAVVRAENDIIQVVPVVLMQLLQVSWRGQLFWVT